MSQTQNLEAQLQNLLLALGVIYQSEHEAVRTITKRLNLPQKLITMMLNAGALVARNNPDAMRQIKEGEEIPEIDFIACALLEEARNSLPDDQFGELAMKASKGNLTRAELEQALKRQQQ